MKVLAIVLLCAFAAVQGRSAPVSNTKAVAVLGETPYIVHLRIAVATSGFLNTCAGSLIGNTPSSTWILTAASCVQHARFIWTRFGVVNVINPSLVRESSDNRVHPTANVALLEISRAVETTANIAPVTSIGGDVPDSATFYGFGSNDENGPGEQLTSFTVTLEKTDDEGITATSEDGAITPFDIGTPLVADGVQFGIVVGSGPYNAGIVQDTADLVDWIESETGLAVTRAGAKSTEVDSLKVLVVN